LPLILSLKSVIAALFMPVDPSVNRVDDCSWGDGSTGKLIESATVFFHGPQLFGQTL